VTVTPTRPVAVAARGWGWRHATRKAWAVRGLDLEIAAGQRVLLLGASGAGKSTLLAGLAGLLDPGVGEQQGALLLDGVPARRARVEGVRAGQARAGLLLQDPEAQTVLARCGDDVAFGLENHAVPREEIWPRVDEALAAVDFPYPRERSTAALSGGQRQRLALAGVLALAPGLLLLDEPTAMLDPDGRELIRRQVLALLQRWSSTGWNPGSSTSTGWSCCSRAAAPVPMAHPPPSCSTRAKRWPRRGSGFPAGRPRRAAGRSGPRIPCCGRRGWRSAARD
jgi:energy-coupling factor transporter ATP-binding protein EcfA2